MNDLRVLLRDAVEMLDRRWRACPFCQMSLVEGDGYDHHADGCHLEGWLTSARSGLNEAPTPDAGSAPVQCTWDHAAWCRVQTGGECDCATWSRREKGGCQCEECRQWRIDNLPGSRGTTEHAMAAVANERNRQRAKWGVQQHGPAEWMAILGEEFGEACREAVDVQWEHPGFSWERLRQEVVETAAVAVQIVEWLDSRPVSKEVRDDA